MTPINFQNSSAPNSFQFADSSSSHNFFYSTTHDPQDQSGYYRKELHQRLPIQQDQDNYVVHGGSYDMENVSSDNGLKFSIWKNEDKYAKGRADEITKNNQVKWMSSKMRLMHKMKNDIDCMAGNGPLVTPSLLKLEDQKQQPSSPMETNSSNTCSNNSNSQIRVCSDCNTTKTPLWRSGPQGPKSLCNACGIRQRKARRAMAAAANGTAIYQTEKTPVVHVKAQQKEKKPSAIITTSGHVTKYKKKSSKLLQPDATTRTNTTNTPHQVTKKLCFEDFLVSLSKKLAFHHVFPQDEKEAAILLMALSCGHVHG